MEKMVKQHREGAFYFDIKGGKPEPLAGQQTAKDANHGRRSERWPRNSDSCDRLVRP